MVIVHSLPKVAWASKFFRLFVSSRANLDSDLAKKTTMTSAVTSGFDSLRSLKRYQFIAELSSVKLLSVPV